MAITLPAGVSLDEDFRVKVTEGFSITPHREAPMYRDNDQDQKLILKAMKLMATGGPKTDEDMVLVRQTGFVNLYFFLKYIASYSGPYQLLDSDLHLDMCNFYQEVCLQPGIRAGVFLGRGHFKSTVVTHGSNAWEVLRDPEIEIIQTSNVLGRAQEFLDYTKDVFASNELFAALYPEYVLREKRAKNNNAEKFQVPNKTRNKAKPNIQIAAVMGSIQGMHAPVFKVDDLIGEHMLDSARNLGSDAVKATNWAKGAVENIPNVASKSRIIVTGTRYGIDDGYGWQWKSVKKLYGYTNGEPYEEVSDGVWTLYYRMSREERTYQDSEGRMEHITFPDKWSHRELDRIMEEDPWNYYTQLQNLSRWSGNAALSDYVLGDAYVDVGDDGEWWVTYGDNHERRLSEADLVAGIDPGASDSRKSASTSRSALVLLARFWDGVRVLVEARAGYVKSTEMFDWMFQVHRRYPILRVQHLEAQGPFKALDGPLRREQEYRKQYLNVRPVSSPGNKFTVIESTLQPVLEHSKVYATKDAMKVVHGELMAFPNGKQMDVLDAWAIAEKASRQPDKPIDEYDEEEHQYRVLMSRRSRSKVTGY